MTSKQLTQVRELYESVMGRDKRKPDTEVDWQEEQEEEEQGTEEKTLRKRRSSSLVSMFGDFPSDEVSLRRRSIGESFEDVDVNDKILSSLGELVSVVFNESIGDIVERAERKPRPSLRHRSKLRLPVAEEIDTDNENEVEEDEQIKGNEHEFVKDLGESDYDTAIGAALGIGNSASNVNRSLGGESQEYLSESFEDVEDAEGGVVEMGCTSDDDVAAAIAAVDRFTQEEKKALELKLENHIGDTNEKMDVDDEQETEGQLSDDNPISVINEANVIGGDWGRWKAATKAATSRGKKLAKKISSATKKKYSFRSSGLPQSGDGGSELWFEIEPEESGSTIYYLGFQLTSGKDEEQIWTVKLMKGAGLGSATSVGSEKGLTSKVLSSAVIKLAEKV